MEIQTSIMSKVGEEEEDGHDSNTVNLPTGVALSRFLESLLYL